MCVIKLCLTILKRLCLYRMNEKEVLLLFIIKVCFITKNDIFLK